MFGLGVSNSYVWGLGILTFGGKGFLRLEVSFLTFGVRNSHIWGLVFLRLGVRDSYVLGLVFYVSGLVILTYKIDFCY